MQTGIPPNTQTLSDTPRINLREHIDEASFIFEAANNLRGIYTNATQDMFRPTYFGPGQIRGIVIPYLDPLTEGDEITFELPKYYVTRFKTTIPGSLWTRTLNGVFQMRILDVGYEPVDKTLVLNIDFEVTSLNTVMTGTTPNEIGGFNILAGDLPSYDYRGSTLVTHTIPYGIIYFTGNYSTTPSQIQQPEGIHNDFPKLNSKLGLSKPTPIKTLINLFRRKKEGQRANMK